MKTVVGRITRDEIPVAEIYEDGKIKTLIPNPPVELTDITETIKYCIKRGLPPFNPAVMAVYEMAEGPEGGKFYEIYQLIPLVDRLYGLIPDVII